MKLEILETGCTLLSLQLGVFKNIGLFRHDKFFKKKELNSAEGIDIF